MIWDGWMDWGWMDELGDGWTDWGMERGMDWKWMGGHGMYGGLGMDGLPGSGCVDWGLGMNESPWVMDGWSEDGWVTLGADGWLGQDKTSIIGVALEMDGCLGGVGG